MAVFAAVMFLTWSRTFSIQKALASDPSASAAVRVALAGNCFPARKLGDSVEPSGSAAKITSDLYTEEAREQAGADAKSL